MTGWGLFVPNGVAEVTNLNDTAVAKLQNGSTNTVMYWLAPADYLGNRVSCLLYKISYR